LRVYNRSRDKGEALSDHGATLAPKPGAIAVPGGIETWSLTLLRERLIKTGARLVRHARYAIFQMADDPRRGRFSLASLS
jgi:hypothetical protein